ncbi:hypothetical protein BEN78_05055 [Xanthomonas citri pv. mangiferaeindicae]|nr:hypothetical protein BEN78_05055 [Xanthomonas citri pv. mangiferaeindicae]
MDLKHKLLLGFMAAFGFVLLVHELQPKPVSSTRTPQMFEVLSSNFESRLYVDLRNLDTGRVHRLVYAGKRCYGSSVRVGSRWALPAITEQYKDGSLRYGVDARSLCRR